MPRMQFPPIQSPFPAPVPSQHPVSFPQQPVKEAPLDLSRKATKANATTIAANNQRKSRNSSVNSGNCQQSHHRSHHHHHHGSGKQPIPRCFECKRLFPSLWDLNAHFLREHQSSLQREFTQNRSWKTCSLENISVQVNTNVPTPVLFWVF